MKVLREKTQNLTKMPFFNTSRGTSVALRTANLPSMLNCPGQGDQRAAEEAGPTYNTFNSRRVVDSSEDL